jgi:hypothetical protein
LKVEKRERDSFITYIFLKQLPRIENTFHQEAKQTKKKVQLTETTVACLNAHDFMCAYS